MHALIHFDQTLTQHALIRACMLICFLEILRPNLEFSLQKLGLVLVNFVNLAHW